MVLVMGRQDEAMRPNSFASTAHHQALNKMAEGGRWIGGDAATIDRDLIRACTESTDAGKILDLNFHGKFVHQVTGLEPYAANLRSLDLSYNNLRQVEGLKGMCRLRELKLYGCQISRISGLEPCVSLVSLHLDDNCINAVEGLDALKLLEYLNLDNNKIQRLGKGIMRLTKLRELHVARNRLVSLEGVAGLGALEVLTAGSNQIQEISPEQVKGLVRLDEMRLEGNLLGSLSFLKEVAGSAQSLPNLATLDVSCNQITAEALRGLPCLPQLAELNLAENRIEDIPAGVANSWQSLEILDLSRNQLQRTEQLEPLKQLVSLRELALQGNPVGSENEEEVSRVVASLGALEYLDDRPLPASELGTPALEAGEGEDAKTFALTNSRVQGSSRPSTGDSRPSTSSRPGTAQAMKEAGVKEPLMHAKLKLSERRFASEEQVMQWEKQTMNGLAAIERQIQKVAALADRELAHMDKCVEKAQKVMQRQRELQAQGKCPSVPEESAEETLRAVSPSVASEPPASSPPSRLGRRLREAVDLARADGNDASPPAGAGGPGTSSGSYAVPKPESPKFRKEMPRKPSLPADCDEEIVDDTVASGPASGCATDAEEEEPPQVITEAEEEPDTPAALPRRRQAAGRAPPTQAEMHVGIRSTSRRTRRPTGGSVGPARPAGGNAGAARKPPLMKAPPR